MPDELPTNYFAFLVRLWRFDEKTTWRAILQDPHTGKQFRFDTVESLFAFLQDQMGLNALIAAPPPKPESPAVES